MSTKILPPNEPLMVGTGLSPVWWRNLQSLTQTNVGFSDRVGSTFTADWSQSDEIRLPLNNTFTTITNSGASDGQRCLLTLTQDFGGGQAVAFTSETIFGPSGLPKLDPTPDTRSHFEFVFNSNLKLYDMLSFTTGLGAPLTPPTILGPKVINFLTGSTVTLMETNVDLVINKDPGSPTLVYLPKDPADAQTIRIKDGKGDAAANHITVNGFGHLIDTDVTRVIDINFTSLSFAWNADEKQWNIV